ncbi:MAG: MOSC domain-containing protein [Acidobacteria bacterium]|nr:MAG: MOSC domain-containing protein [Acidobacteriota bacterium]
MKLTSVNVGFPREVTWDGGRVATGIFKRPVSGPVRVQRLNLVGDKQADLSVHGGPDKAVYAYPAEHYAYWGRELEDDELPWGMFGENLTTEGLDEGAVRIGDRLRVGTAELSVTQPRVPCYKLGIRFGRPEMVKRFLNSRRTGFYLAVAQEGEIDSGDRIELVARDANSLTVADIFRLYAFQKNDREMLQRAAQLEALPGTWRSYFLEQLQRSSR